MIKEVLEKRMISKNGEIIWSDSHNKTNFTLFSYEKQIVKVYQDVI